MLAYFEPVDFFKITKFRIFTCFINRFKIRLRYIYLYTCSVARQDETITAYKSVDMNQQLARIWFSEKSFKKSRDTICGFENRLFLQLK